jgi:hypothetical protein
MHPHVTLVMRRLAWLQILLNTAALTNCWLLVFDLLEIVSSLINAILLSRVMGINSSFSFRIWFWRMCYYWTFRAASIDHRDDSTVLSFSTYLRIAPLKACFIRISLCFLLLLLIRCPP